MFEFKFAVVPDSKYDETADILNEYGKNGWSFTGYTHDGGNSIDFLLTRELPRTPVGPDHKCPNSTLCASTGMCAGNGQNVSTCPYKKDS